MAEENTQSDCGFQNPVDDRTLQEQLMGKVELMELIDEQNEIE